MNSKTALDNIFGVSATPYVSPNVNPTKQQQECADGHQQPHPPSIEPTVTHSAVMKVMHNMPVLIVAICLLFISYVGVYTCARNNRRLSEVVLIAVCMAICLLFITIGAPSTNNVCVTDKCACLLTMQPKSGV